MRKYLLLLLCLPINFINAQLSVQNDSFVFVNDQVLFVNDYVNLNQADSKIYLRNDSQLIQGSGTTGNSGIGQLSVYQNGTTHNYAYNYWCSPVGNNSSTLGNESFTANLFDEATGLITSTDASFTAYDGVSSPLTIAYYWIYTFENATGYSEWLYRRESGSIAPGLGFTMKGTSGSGNNQLYDFRGKPHNGTIANSVTAAAWTLVGNPYPSALDAVSYIHDAENMAAITGTLYFWEQDLSVMSHNIADYVGGYATYTVNATGTVETFIPATFDTYNSDGSLNTTGAASTSGKQVRRYIPIGQGFMVEGNATTSGIVRTKNSHRVFYKQAGSDSIFFTPTDTGNTNTQTNHYAEVPDDYKRFRLNIDFDNLYTRQLVQTFHDREATFGVDYGLESKSPLDVSNDAYWVIENEPYVAQALPFDPNMSIPLHIKLNKNGAIRIRIFDIQNFDDGQEIFVHDIEEGTYTNISVFPFEIQLNEGTYTDRFEIVFTASTLTIDDIITDSFNVYQNNHQKQLIIKNPDLLEIKNIQLYDLLGKVIWSSHTVNTQHQYTIDTSALSDAVYITKVQTQEDKTFTKKVLITNKSQ